MLHRFLFQVSISFIRKFTTKSRIQTTIQGRQLVYLTDKDTDQGFVSRLFLGTKINPKMELTLLRNNTPPTSKRFRNTPATRKYRTQAFIKTTGKQMKCFPSMRCKAAPKIANSEALEDSLYA
ncbi:unnamed protein product [Amoebophrya sp. A120]|nr:unnamed protein product [Amoebophrya sp. A120]|eukprot:GSA120T00025961001.1